MSFSQEAKNDLCTISLKNKCCKASLLYGMLLFSGIYTGTRIKLITETEGVASLFSGLLHSLADVEANLYISEKKSGEERINSYKLTVAIKSEVQKVIELFGDSTDSINTEIFKCEACKSSFLRGAFLVGGSVSSPKSAYHLDLTTPSANLANQLCEMINSDKQLNLQAKCTERQGRMAVYLKDSERIQDFLTLIGAQGSALEMMNEKIFKDVRNYENRRSNCETANIYRTTGSAGEQTRAINKLITEGRFEELPEDLQITANLRLENPFASLDQIAMMHTPPISKSGVNHRLKKIVEISKK